MDQIPLLYYFSSHLPQPWPGSASARTINRSPKLSTSLSARTPLPPPFTSASPIFPPCHGLWRPPLEQGLIQLHSIGQPPIYPSPLSQFGKAGLGKALLYFRERKRRRRPSLPILTPRIS
ncbi:dnaJ protein ERDJ2-like [Iris pallida]|uniref:DnaJ protein ERDJ2-like n=1 Tax=Iris pallida TaxID=29817 RepID=A0AAX6HF41_IRIPA|nr:dnaJ protein ERDJ2-like [Iris pallida]